MSNAYGNCPQKVFFSNYGLQKCSAVQILDRLTISFRPYFLESGAEHYGVSYCKNNVLKFIKKTTLKMDSELPTLKKDEGFSFNKLMKFIYEIIKCY